jgi:flagellar protein FlgJ
MSDFSGISNFMLPSQPLASQIRDPKGSKNKSATLDQACRDFESVFINYMLQQMRRTVPRDGLFNGGQAEQIYTSMLDNETAKSISRQGGLGLADLLREQLSSQEPIKKNE